MTYAVETIGLCRNYGAIKAVDYLNLQVPVQAIFAVIGPNGAGKTTLFSLLAGFIKPHKGSIEILGKKTAASIIKTGKIGALCQDAELYPDFSPLTLMRMLGRLQGLRDSHLEQQVEDRLQRVGLTDKKRAKIGGLSHGMRKRLAIAQAFLGDPEIILLDEPTSGLDPRHAREVKELIIDFSSRTTMIISSHNLTEVEELCSHALIIDQGRQIFQGPIAEITEQEKVIWLVLDLDALPPQLEKEIDQIKACRTQWQADKKLLKLTFTLSKTEVNEQLRELMQKMLLMKIDIREVKRGQSLEDSFLDSLQNHNT